MAAAALGLHRRLAPPNRGPAARRATAPLEARLLGASAQATRRRLDVRPAAGRAESVRPKARTMRMTVLNSGLPVSPRALYKLSRFKPAFFAISPIPRARATRPRASR